MSKVGYKSTTTTSKSQYVKQTKNSNNNIQSSSQKKSDFKDFEVDSDFFEDFNPEPPGGRIIQHTTEQSYDDQGNRITKTKIVREIDETNTKNINGSRKMSKKIKTENNRNGKYSNVKNEVERQKALYSSPDFQSNSPFESPIFMNDRRDSKNYEEMGYKSNFTYESKKVNGKNVGTYSTKEKYEYIDRNGRRESKYEKSSQGSPSQVNTEIISPVAYIENNSSGSDYDENQMKSFENYNHNTNSNINTLTNNNIKTKTKKAYKNKYKLNYELEDPEGFDYLARNERKIINVSTELKKSHYTNRSQLRNKIEDSYRSDRKDFESPDRNLNEANRFRNVNMRMIDSKGPSNDDGKINNIITKEIIETKKVKKNGSYYYSKDPNIRVKAARIIQEWWRNKYNREEEVYDITVKSAVKLQSFIRGFLVRKKVLRYITLAIYYQSFCDKLQDVLCNNVKKELFKFFKDKYLYNYKRTTQRVTKEILYNRRQLLKYIVEKNIEKNNFYLLQLLRRWKAKAYKIKIIDRGNRSRKMIKNNTSSNFNTTKTYTDKTIVKSTINTYADKRTINSTISSYTDRKESNPNKYNINSYNDKKSLNCYTERKTQNTYNNNDNIKRYNSFYNRKTDDRNYQNTAVKETIVKTVRKNTKDSNTSYNNYKNNTSFNNDKNNASYNNFKNNIPKNYQNNTSYNKYQNNTSYNKYQNNTSYNNCKKNIQSNINESTYRSIKYPSSKTSRETVKTEVYKSTYTQVNNKVNRSPYTQTPTKVCYSPPSNTKKVNYSPYTCTCTCSRSTSNVKISHNSPDLYRKSYNTKTYDWKNDKNYNYSNYKYNNLNKSTNLNTSYDSDFYKKYRVDRKYATSTEKNHYKCFHRVENSKNKEEKKDRNISPKFGTLRQSNQVKKTITNNNFNNNHIKEIKVINKRKTISDFSNLDANKSNKITNISIANTNNIKNKKALNIVSRRKTANNIINSNKKKNNINNTVSTIKTTKKIIRNVITKKSTSNNLKKNNSKKKTVNTKKDTKKGKNEVISGGTLSIIKLPHRRKNSYSGSENIYKKERIIRSVENYGRRRKEYIPRNTIDNQLAISIVKLNNNKSEKRLNRTMVEEDYHSTYERVPKIIERIREKIIIQKEKPPETAEEGNDFQVFDMKISKRISMNIKPSTELRKIIKDENKEIEIYKKREREKNQEIDKYKKDIELQKEKSKLDFLKRAIRIVETFKKMILHKKFLQYKNNCFNKEPAILEIDGFIDMEIKNIPKKTRDFSVQISNKTETEKKEIIKEEYPRHFKVLKITQNRSVSFEPKEKKTKKSDFSNNTITRAKLNIISNIKKKDAGQQLDPWYTEIDYLENTVAYEIDRPKKVENGSQYTQSKNIKGKVEQINIIGSKPKMVDDSVQHEYEENYIEFDELEIPATKPKRSESKVSKENKFSIISKKKKEVIKKVQTCDEGSNTMILKTKDIGINAIEKVKEKPKNIEVQIRTVKRSLTKMEIPLLKRLWLRKAFRTFRENCNRPLFHKILERELLRMALLRWRFVRGYGPDRYGNAYDRDGNLLYRVRGKVADFEAQNDFFVEQEDEGTQYVPAKNIIKTLAKFEIGPIYKKPAKKLTKDVSVGNNIKLDERIIRGESINIRQKSKSKKKENKMMRNNSLLILRQSKKIKDSCTQMPGYNIEIDKMDDFNVIDKQGKIKYNERIKEILIQLVYRKIIGDKLNLSEALRRWVKHTLIESQIEENELEWMRRTQQSKIRKNDRFSLIEKIMKEDASTQMNIKTYKNKIDRILELNLVNIKKMKNAEINVNIPYQFDLDNIKPKTENKIVYKSTKRPVVLKRENENSMNIFSQDYIFNEEVRRGIHHPMTEESMERVTEILYKFFEARGGPLSLLRKYFTIWYRKSKYLTYLNNARIISLFCKTNLNKLSAARKWKKLTQKLMLNEKVKIIKISKERYFVKKKIFDLIRLTRINTIYSKRRYLHFIIIAWLVYTRNIRQKRSHVQTLYENMLSTYMNIADDVFGNNQKENPSVQDALFEAVDSTKFQTKNLQDVPLAKEYYENRKEFTKISKSIGYFNNEDNKDRDYETREHITYKSYLSNKNPNTTYSSYGVNNNSENSRYSDKKSRGISKEKVIDVKEEERMQSKGRGRAFRTKNQNEIIFRYNNNANKIYGKRRRIEDEDDDDEDNEENDEKEINNNYNISNRSSNRGEIKNNIIYNSSNRGDYKKSNNMTISSINREEISRYNDFDEENIMAKTDREERRGMTYTEKRKLFKKKFEEK